MDTITQDGEIVETGSLARIDNSAMISLARAEIDVQISTARSYPRDVVRVMKAVASLATIDEETAQECLYALVRGKKKLGAEQNTAIEGPSIRLAELAAQCYGNCRIDARVISVNRAEKYVEAEGIFHDLETNMASRATVRRSISTSSGGIYSQDMIVVTGNAACAIAKRNAILAGIPRSVYRPAYNQAREMIAGTVEALGKNRGKAIAAFAAYGVTAAQILEALGVSGESDVTTDHIAKLRGMFAALKNREATVEEMFGKGGGSQHGTVASPLSDDAPPKTQNPSKERVPDANADTQNGARETPATTPAATDIARQRGRDAFLAGKTERDLPKEYWPADREAEMTAWSESWEDARSNATDQQGDAQ